MDKFSNHLAKKKMGRMGTMGTMIYHQQARVYSLKKQLGSWVFTMNRMWVAFLFYPSCTWISKLKFTVSYTQWNFMDNFNWMLRFLFFMTFLFYINSSVTLQNLLKNNYIQPPIIFMFNLTLSFIKANFPSKITYGFLTFIFQFT